MIKLSNVSKKFKKQEVFKNVNLELPSCGLYFLTGRSGSGKSTLFKMISGLDKIYSGKIELDKNLRVAYLPQENYFFDDLSLGKALNFIPYIIEEERIKKYLSLFELDSKLDQSLATLSCGEKKRVLLLFNVLAKYDAILIDEPFSALDDENRSIYLKVINELKKEMLIIISSHDFVDESICKGIIKIKNRSISLDVKDDEVDKPITNNELMKRKKVYRDVLLLAKKKFISKVNIFIGILICLFSIVFSFCSSILSTNSNYLLEKSLNLYDSNFVEIKTVKGMMPTHGWLLDSKKEKCNTYFQFKTLDFNEYFKDKDYGYFYLTNAISKDQIMLNEDTTNYTDFKDVIINNNLPANTVAFSYEYMNDIFQYFNENARLVKNIEQEKSYQIEFTKIDSEIYNILFEDVDLSYSFVNQYTFIDIAIGNRQSQFDDFFNYSISSAEAPNNKIIVDESLKNGFIFYLYNMDCYIEAESIIDLRDFLKSRDFVSINDFYSTWLDFKSVYSDLKIVSIIVGILCICSVIVFYFIQWKYFINYFIKYTSIFLLLGNQKKKYDILYILIHIFELLVMFLLVYLLGLSVIALLGNRKVASLLAISIFTDFKYFICFCIVPFIMTGIMFVIGYIIYLNRSFDAKRRSLN